MFSSKFTISDVTVYLWIAGEVDSGATMNQIFRAAKFANSPSVLVTAQEVIVPRVYEKFNVAHYKEAKTMPRDLLLQEIPKHEGLYCLLRDKIDKQVLDQAKKLKVISTMSVGFDHIDIKECKKRGIIVTTTPDVLTETTAETTVALLLATARRFPEAIREAKTGGWGTWQPFYMCGVGLRDSTVGIIGFGRIGQSVAKKIKAFGPSKILFFDPCPNQEVARAVGAEAASVEEILSKSDFVILTCAATAENKGMMNKAMFKKMKKNAVLVNTSRGTLVVQNDLHEALKNGTIRAAGLDVTTPEPLPLDSPLFKLDNCLVLPHIGSATEATRKDMMELAESGLIAGLTGQEIPAKVRVA